jgi:hypothetical protein
MFQRSEARISNIFCGSPKFSELGFESLVPCQQVGADRADRHRHAAAHVGKVNQQTLARIRGGYAALLVDDRG